MRRGRHVTEDLQTLLARYATAAAAHGKATLDQDPSEANRQYHKLHSVYAAFDGEVHRRSES